MPTQRLSLPPSSSLAIGLSVAHIACMSDAGGIEEAGTAEVRWVRAWIRLGDPFKAANEVFPNDPGKACRVNFEWPQREDLIELRAQLLADEGEKAFLPSRADLARRLWTIGSDTTVSADDQINALETYGKVMGFIEKPGVTVNNNTLINNKTMIVKDHGSDDRWEAQLLDQQERLIAQH